MPSSTISRARAAAPIRRTLELAATVASVLPRPKPGQVHPATRTFQALRIAVNDELGQLAAALAGKTRLVLLIGRDAALIEAALAGQVPTERCATLEDAVIAAAGIAQPGDTVLLSPACASQDMFRDYVDRGEVFTDAVRRLAA